MQRLLVVHSPNEHDNPGHYVFAGQPTFHPSSVLCPYCSGPMREMTGQAIAIVRHQVNLGADFGDKLPPDYHVLSCGACKQRFCTPQAVA